MLQLGPTLTCYSTIWPIMDPAHSTPPQNRLEKIEQVLQHQDARFAGLQDEVGQALAALTAQLGNLTAALTQAVPMAPLSGHDTPSSHFPTSHATTRALGGNPGARRGRPGGLQARTLLTAPFCSCYSPTPSLRRKPW